MKINIFLKISRGAEHPSKIIVKCAIAPQYSAPGYCVLDLSKLQNVLFSKRKNENKMLNKRIYLFLTLFS